MKQLTDSFLATKKTIILICIIGFLHSLMSCEKKEEISFEFQQIDLVCFPDDRIYLTFGVIPEGGTEPYQIEWYEPSGLQGFGPLLVKVSDNLLFDFKITDVEQMSERNVYEIKKDTIDSLQYDYRNGFAGIYICSVVNAYAGTEKYYFDTLTVSKPDDFRSILISTSEINWGMSYLDSNQFYGYHRGVTFSNDSIRFSESGPLGHYYTNTYRGRKTGTD